MGFDIDRAIELAVLAHRGQRDKGRPMLPYVTHPMRVMACFDDPELQMIAVLHDAVEDSDGKVTLATLRAEGAPARVINAVDALTHRRNEARPDYIIRVAQNPDALAVKLVDNADNSNEERLALLPSETADRLRTKYETDRALLLSLHG